MSTLMAVTRWRDADREVQCPARTQRGSVWEVPHAGAGEAGRRRDKRRSRGHRVSLQPPRDSPWGQPDPDSFHRAAGPLLLVGRALSLLPLQGVRGPDASALRFRWCSIAMVYTLTILSGCLFMLWTSAKKIFVQSWNFEDTEVVFFSLSLTLVVLFVDLARKWPRLALEWQGVERAAARYGSPSGLAARAKAFTVFIMAAGSVEHVLSHAKTATAAFHCTDGRASEWMDYFFKAEYSQIFAEVRYSAWAGVLATIIGFFATYVWNYVDTFIVVVSMSLAARFKLLSRRLRSALHQMRSEDDWRQMREDYNSLSWLCLSVDEALSKLVLLSFTSNVYFVCLQLYHSIRPVKNAAEIVYFYYSVGFLLLRIVLVAVNAAAINDESKEPKTIIFSVPSRSFSSEVQRFLLQVTFDEVVLTGMKFFSVTRSLILTIAGTIVTYEIFLIQFHNTGTDDLLRMNSSNATTCSMQTFSHSY